VGECFDASQAPCYEPEFSSGFCAYHSNISSQTLYAFQPWADLTGCFYSSLPDNAYPNDDGADPLLNVVSHEHNETITDPLGTAWFDNSGFENGDECAWLSLATQFNGIGDYSQTIAGDQYMLQSEWSNRSNSCVETNTFPQPTGTFTTATGAAAHSVNFTSSVADSDDSTFRYSWTFGDGAKSTAASPSHTYVSAGSKIVTLTVFDAHGDQLRVVKAVTVS
jgi:peptidyl-Asp metalloendopeptidase